MKQTFLSAFTAVVSLCIVIFAVSSFFISNERLLGVVLIGLFAVCILALIPFRIPFHSIQPDIIFGVVDNGILAALALLGGALAGVPGAIAGGVVGNAITDGIAGFFEGHSSERLRRNNVNDSRTILGSAIGKMAGCLLGAGFVLIVANLF